jgi:hypothetical protein
VEESLRKIEALTAETRRKAGEILRCAQDGYERRKAGEASLA